MCLAIPMRITAIAGQMATIELGGLSQRASVLLVPEAAVGDYVLVHAGCAITVLDEEEAHETFALFAEIAEFEAQSVDGAGPDEGDRPEDSTGEAAAS